MKPEEVRQIREEAQMTQAELATYLGLRHRSQVHHLETGRTKADGSKAKLLEQLHADSARKKTRKSRPSS